MRIAIISARLVSIDGVSVEAEKWRATFRRLGHEVVLCAGTFGGDPHGPHVRIPSFPSSTGSASTSWTWKT